MDTGSPKGTLPLEGRGSYPCALAFVGPSLATVAGHPRSSGGGNSTRPSKALASLPRTPTIRVDCVGERGCHARARHPLQDGWPRWGRRRSSIGCTSEQANQLPRGRSK
eukprot:7266843-Pyramimonas_sp.AAC.1